MCFKTNRLWNYMNVLLIKKYFTFKGPEFLIVISLTMCVCIHTWNKGLVAAHADYVTSIAGYFWTATAADEVKLVVRVSARLRIDVKFWIKRSFPADADNRKEVMCSCIFLLVSKDKILVYIGIIMIIQRFSYIFKYSKNKKAGLENNWKL